MSLEVLSKDILLKAEEEKISFSQMLKEETTVLEKEFEEKLEDFKKIVSSKNKIELDFQKNKILGFYKKEAKHLILDIKSKIIEETFNDTLDFINNFNGEQRAKLITKLVKIAQNQIQVEEIVCARKDIKTIKKIVPSNIKISSIENFNGILAESNSGKEIINLSFENLLKDIFEANEDKVQRTLFNY